MPKWKCYRSSNTANEEISRNKAKLTFSASQRGSIPWSPILLCEKVSVLIVLLAWTTNHGRTVVLLDAVTEQMRNISKKNTHNRHRQCWPNLFAILVSNSMERKVQGRPRFRNYLLPNFDHVLFLMNLQKLATQVSFSVPR